MVREHEAPGREARLQVETKTRKPNVSIERVFRLRRRISPRNREGSADGHTAFR